jgi:NADPH2:quinone reductase
MKAILLKKTGGPEVLKVTSVADPSVGDRDCLIRIKFAGVNYADVLSRQGIYNWQGKLPYILGLESSGVVERTGRLVTRFKVGDAVVVGSKGGNYAELTSRPETDVLKAPEGLTFEQSACLCGNWLTAWCAMLEMARVRADEIALIQSGAGGVGTAAIQLGIAHRMKVFATASSQTKKDYIANLGAVPLDYSNFAEALKKIPPDFILESAGGDVHKQSLKVLAPLGRMVSIGASSIKINKLNPLDWYHAWRNYPAVSRTDLNSQGYMTLHMGFLLEQSRDRIDPMWLRMIDFMQKHNLKPILQENAVFPMSEAGKAHELLDSRQNIGRLLLDPSR